MGEIDPVAVRLAMLFAIVLQQFEGLLDPAAFLGLVVFEQRVAQRADAADEQEELLAAGQVFVGPAEREAVIANQRQDDDRDDRRDEHDFHHDFWHSGSHCGFAAQQIGGSAAK